MFLKKIYQKIRRLGIPTRLGYAWIWGLCKIFPPPPKGNAPPIWLSPPFPHGLVAIGGLVTPESLLQAYSKGFYPFYDAHPVDWYSCDPRMVLFLERMSLKKGLRPVLKSGRYRVTFDTAFARVVEICSARSWTWLIPERIEVALKLHEQGHAHSVEVWNQEGDLVGGLFGVDMGRMFLSESAFSHEKDAMRVAVSFLNCHLQHWGYVLNDVQAFQEHFRRMGYEEISRRRYIKLLPTVVSENKRLGKWSVDPQLNVGNWIPSEPGSQLEVKE